MKEVIDILCKLFVEFVGIFIGDILNMRNTGTKVIVQIHDADAEAHHCQKDKVQGAGEPFLHLQGYLKKFHNYLSCLKLLFFDLVANAPDYL